jgi:hypothetical protein
MKRFKNYVSVKGTEKELKAFAKQLEKVGYHTAKGCVTQEYEAGRTHIICYEDGEYGYYRHCGNAMLFELPKQKEYALKAITETIEIDETI